MTRGEEFTSDEVISVDGESVAPAVRRLPFVDGMRGVAAVVVMLGHFIFLVPHMHQPGPAGAGLRDWLAWPFRFSGEMVLFFLMISGFSLYYSELSRQARGRPATTIRQFLARRAWRIGPVYYLAMALGTIVMLSVRSHLTLPANNGGGAVHLTVGGVISHLFLVQTFTSGWYYQVNSPLWSIAYEAQLYLLFPVLFIAMRRWNPWLVAVATAGIVHLISRLDLGFPIFGLARWFVAGALVAEVWDRGFHPPARVTLPIGIAGLLVATSQRPQLASELRHDAIWLVAFLGILLAGLAFPAERRNPFTWRWVRWLGLRSYSVYALHFPVLMVLLLIAQDHDLHGWTGAAFCVGVGTPVSLALAAVSFRYVEGPSLRRVAAVGASSRSS